jgi:hypothetical protein
MSGSVGLVVHRPRMIKEPRGGRCESARTEANIAHSLKFLQVSRLLSHPSLGGRRWVSQPGIAVMFSVEWWTSVSARPLNVQTQLK